jgi:hypothetical protein
MSKSWKFLQGFYPITVVRIEDIFTDFTGFRGDAAASLRLVKFDEES